MPRGTSRYDEARLQGRLWTPALLRGSGSLEAWHDFGDTSTMAITTSVNTVRDKSGRGRDLATAANLTASSAIAYSVVKGCQALLFNGSNSNIVSTSFALAQPFTIFQFLRTKTMSNATPVSFMNAGQTWFVEPKRSANSNLPSFSTDGFGTTTFSMPSVLSTNTNYLWYIFLNGSSSEGAFNGATATTGNAGVGNLTTGFALSLTGANAWEGYYLEQVIVSGSNTASFRSRVEGYLMWKWGTQGDLPASHPYANRPPLIGV